MSLHASTGSLRSTSPPLTPFEGRFASNDSGSDHGTAIRIKNGDDDDYSQNDDYVDVLNMDSAHATLPNNSDLEPQQAPPRGRGRPRRDSVSAGGKKSKSNKVRKTERSLSPRGEEGLANGRRRVDSMEIDGLTTPGVVSPPSTPSIVISDQSDMADPSPLLMTSPPGQISLVEGDRSTPSGKRGNVNRTPPGRQRRNSSSSNNGILRKPSPEAPQLPPKQPKQASPTVRPRRTRKVRMYDPYSDKSAHPLSKPLQACMEILQELMDHEYGWVFNTPVDPISLEIPDYFDVIKNPMDLGTIKVGFILLENGCLNGIFNALRQTQLQSGHYETPEEFAEDVRLVWSNALTYNSEVVLPVLIRRVHHLSAEHLSFWLRRRTMCTFWQKNFSTRSNRPLPACNLIGTGIRNNISAKHHPASGTARPSNNPLQLLPQRQQLLRLSSQLWMSRKTVKKRIRRNGKI